MAAELQDFQELKVSISKGLKTQQLQASFDAMTPDQKVFRAKVLEQAQSNLDALQRTLARAQKVAFGFATDALKLEHLENTTDAQIAFTVVQEVFERMKFVDTTNEEKHRQHIETMQDIFEAFEHFSMETLMELVRGFILFPLRNTSSVGAQELLKQNQRVISILGQFSASLLDMNESKRARRIERNNEELNFTFSPSTNVRPEMVANNRLRIERELKKRGMHDSVITDFYTEEEFMTQLHARKHYEEVKARQDEINETCRFKIPERLKIQESPQFQTPKGYYEFIQRVEQGREERLRKSQLIPEYCQPDASPSLKQSGPK